MAEPQTLARDDLLSRLPPEWPEDLLPRIQGLVHQSGRKLVVLDDDPTGTQTVHDVPVLTEWTKECLESELRDPSSVCFVLTNSRSMPRGDAVRLATEIGRNLAEVSRTTGREIVCVSRSDSTLRGHFPEEVDALGEALGGASDACLVAPYFHEGGRLTVDDVHYVAEGDQLVPAGQTEFARDATFGYRSSGLREWIEEKTGGRASAETVASLTLDTLRRGGPEAAAEVLCQLPRGAYCVVNSASPRDMQVAATATLLAEAQGRRFLYRTAASFVQARAGIVPRALLSADELDLPNAGGTLLVVGSHVPRTTEQLSHLLATPDVEAIEAQVEKLAPDDGCDEEVVRVASAASASLHDGRDVVIYTSRSLVEGRDAEESLSLAVRVSAGLVRIVESIEVRPRCLVAKGGITSSDVATKALGVRRALVLGQILPGVPVWRVGDESRWPGMPYVVFPGNVGEPGALADVVRKLRGAGPTSG